MQWRATGSARRITGCLTGSENKKSKAYHFHTLEYARHNRMNNTKWNELFTGFYKYECSSEPITIRWRTKDRLIGFISEWDSKWTHFGCEPREWETIEYLQIKLTAENSDAVIRHLKRIHVPGIITNDTATIYGYRQDVDYI